MSSPGCRWRWPLSISAPDISAKSWPICYSGSARTVCFGSDYAIWSPKWLIEKFMAYELPEDLKQEYYVDLTFEIKRKILGQNAARLYGIDIAAQTAKLSRDGIGGGG
jgi:predicted TIM-barrel fold metal-dependent hydrolase